jgi:RHS repeat-associated protein
MTDSVMGTWSYTYDDFNRLTSGTASAGVDDTLALSWTYDRYGNRWAQSASGSGNISAVQPNLTFDTNNNQVAGWSYDADGNLLNDERNSYTYDAEGRITELNGAKAYVYDAEGRRVAKYSGSSVTATYILDLAGNQVTEFNGSGTWMHSNAWAGGRLLATYEGPGESKPNTYHFHLTDWLSTQRMQTNAAGAAEEMCYSYPFGDGLLCNVSGADATEHHFTSKMRDTESGLDYFGARYLNSNLGRFMTPDWAGAPTAVPYAAFGDPQTLNLYAYVQNEAITSIDTNGHCGGLENCQAPPISGGTGFWDDTAGPYCTSDCGDDHSNYDGSCDCYTSDSGTRNSPPQPSKPKTHFWHNLRQHLDNLVHFRAWNNNGRGGSGHITLYDQFGNLLAAGAGMAPSANPQAVYAKAAANPPRPVTPVPTLKPEPMEPEEIEETDLQKLVKIVADALSNAADGADLFLRDFAPPVFVPQCKDCSLMQANPED